MNTATPSAANEPRRDRSVGAFFVLAYALAWPPFLALQLIGQSAGVSAIELDRMAETTFDLASLRGQLPIPIPLVWLLTRVVNYAPTLAGIVMAGVVAGRAGLRDLLARQVRWNVPVKWYALALLGPFVIGAVAVGLSPLIGTEVGAIAVPLAQVPLIFGMWILVRFFLGGGLGEEAGWRGFALPHMLAHRSPVSASLIIGLVWTFWHLPGHILSDNMVVNLVVQLLFTVPLSFVFTWVYLKARNSLLIVSLLHAVTNAVIGVGLEQVFPALDGEDGWLVIYILLVLVLGIVAAFALRKSETPAASD